MVELKPNIPQEDLANFDQAHFSTVHHAHLSSHFLPPPPPGEVVLEDDDGLGYYPDGQKRTLTDEQIAMFRFSEIQELLRKPPFSPPLYLFSNTLTGRKRRNAKRRQDHKDRKALRKLQEEESAAAEVADRNRAEAAAEQKEKTEEKTEVLPEVARKGRLEAAIWASALEYDENLTGNRGKDVAPAAMVIPVPAKVVPSVGVGGKQFLWPAIAKE